jgi:hypothetical protein
MAVVDYDYRVNIGTYHPDEISIHEYVRDNYFDTTGRLVPIENVYLSREWEYGQPERYDDGAIWVEGNAKVHDPSVG